MGLLGNVVKGLWDGLPQTVEGCDREILRLEKDMNSQKCRGDKYGVARIKNRILDVKAQKKKLQAKK